MSSATDTYVLLRAFVDELARCGMRAACTSPGSRCAPLVLTLTHEARLRCFSHVDERSAGFFALGLAKASGLPVAVACTSGTAAAELLPAAIEAQQARVPLLLLTADRPPELREVGAGEMRPLWGRLSELAMPATVIAGDRDRKFQALARRMVGALPDARLVLLPGGHALALENPAAVARALQGLDAETGV